MHLFFNLFRLVFNLSVEVSWFVQSFHSVYPIAQESVLPKGIENGGRTETKPEYGNINLIKPKAIVVNID